MTQAQGETAVTTSALILSGIYGYRKTTEHITKAPAAKTSANGVRGVLEAPLGVGELVPLGQWATGMGLTMIALSIATSVNPGFGGSFAILIAVGAVLGNGKAVFKDLGVGLGSSGSTPKQAAQPAQAVSSNHPPVK